MTVSDTNSQLLLQSPSSTLRLLVLGLFLDQNNHPRGAAAATQVVPTPVAVQLTYQRNCAEALLQLALSPLGKPALLADPSVTGSLQVVQTWLSWPACCSVLHCFEQFLGVFGGELTLL